MKVRDIMTAKVVAVEGDATITEACRKMRDERVGSVLVIENGELKGILSDRQIAHTAIAQGLDPNKAVARDFMVQDFVPLDPEMNLMNAARLQKELAMRRLPVVENGVAIGILSVSDIAAFVKECMDCILVEEESRVKRRGEFAR